ncbi:hypothetical protein V1514DRAFT_289611 [Lipomyces japonicus]|uniref:uncharacterized protein n=1 Tax=Lipomyces japonicus TaxID=56871 RepID=UPI0034CF9DE9
MSRGTPILKHSNSSTSINTLPMWDSSDPDRHPPPLPLNPDSPVRSINTSKAREFFSGSGRSRSSSPVKQTISQIQPSSISYENTSDNTSKDVILFLRRIFDLAKDTDATLKSADTSIHKTEHGLDSLLRRSKDNAVDLVSLRDKIYSSEILLSHQLQEVQDTLTKALDNTPLRAIGESSIHTENFKDIINPIIVSFKELIDATNSNEIRLGLLVEAVTAIKEQSSKDIDTLSLILKEVQSAQASTIKSESNILGAFSVLQQSATKPDFDVSKKDLQSLQASVDAYDAKFTSAVAQIEAELKNTLLESSSDKTKLYHNVIDQFSKLSPEFISLKSAIEDNGVLVSKQLADLSNKNSELLIDKLDRNNSDALSSVSESFKNVIISIEELKGFFSTRSDSSLESTLHEHEKLDQILKDLSSLSKNIESLSVLPEIHAHFIESTSNFISNSNNEKSTVQLEIDKLREEKSKLQKEVSGLESALTIRTEQFESLESRAEKFQQRLLQHVMEGPRSSGSSAHSAAYNKLTRQTLAILNESAVEPSNRSISSITNSAYTKNDEGSARVILSTSPTHARRTSWSKKIGTMFSAGAGKENELYVPKRGGFKRLGKGRSVSERL